MPSVLMEHCDMEMSDVVELEQYWRNEIVDLSKEWPPERAYGYLLEKKREQYAKTKKYIAELEIKNRDARVNGVPFKERNEKYAKKIRLGASVLAIYKQQGEEFKKRQKEVTGKGYTLGHCGFVNPWDLERAKKLGMQKYLDIYYVF